MYYFKVLICILIAFGCGCLAENKKVPSSEKVLKRRSVAYNLPGYSSHLTVPFAQNFLVGSPGLYKHSAVVHRVPQIVKQHVPYVLRPGGATAVSYQVNYPRIPFSSNRYFGALPGPVPVAPALAPASFVSPLRPIPVAGVPFVHTRPQVVSAPLPIPAPAPAVPIAGAAFAADLPQFPAFPQLPVSLPEFPQLPTFPTALPELPQFAFPTALPELPQFAFPQIPQLPSFPSLSPAAISPVFPQVSVIPGTFSTFFGNASDSWRPIFGSRPASGGPAAPTAPGQPVSPFGGSASRPSITLLPPFQGQGVNVPNPIFPQSVPSFPAPPTHPQNTPSFPQPSPPQNRPSFPQPSPPQHTPSFPQPSPPQHSASFPQPSPPQHAPSFPQPSPPQHSPSFPQPSPPQHSPSFPQPSFPPQSIPAFLPPRRPAASDNNNSARQPYNYYNPSFNSALSSYDVPLQPNQFQ